MTAMMKTMVMMVYPDSGEKSFSKKKCEKRAGAGERPGSLPFLAIFLAATTPFPK